MNFVSRESVWALKLPLMPLMTTCVIVLCVSVGSIFSWIGDDDSSDTTTIMLSVLYTQRPDALTSSKVLENIE